MIDDEQLTAESWMVDSNCKNVDNPDMFFSQHPADIQAAKTMCSNCPVKLLCVSYAIDHDITDGIWGGLTETDRRQIKAAKQAQQKNRIH